MKVEACCMALFSLRRWPICSFNALMYSIAGLVMRLQQPDGKDRRTASEDFDLWYLTANVGLERQELLEVIEEVTDLRVS